MTIDPNIAFLNTPARRRRASARVSDSEQLAILRSQCEVIETKLLKEEARRSFWLQNRAELLKLGRMAPNQSGRLIFTHAGCVAMISAIIDSGPPTRADILHTMRYEYGYSYRHAGFFLSQLCGADPANHLWFMDQTRRYHLHTAASEGDPKLAA